MKSFFPAALALLTLVPAAHATHREHVCYAQCAVLDTAASRLMLLGDATGSSRRGRRDAYEQAGVRCQRLAAAQGYSQRGSLISDASIGGSSRSYREDSSTSSGHHSHTRYGPGYYYDAYGYRYRWWSYGRSGGTHHDSHSSSHRTLVIQDGEVHFEFEFFQAADCVRELVDERFPSTFNGDLPIYP